MAYDIGQVICNTAISKTDRGDLPTGGQSDDHLTHALVYGANITLPTIQSLSSYNFATTIIDHRFQVDCGSPQPFSNLPHVNPSTISLARRSEAADRLRIKSLRPWLHRGYAKASPLSLSSFRTTVCISALACHVRFVVLYSVSCVVVAFFFFSYSRNHQHRGWRNKWRLWETSTRRRRLLRRISTLFHRSSSDWPSVSGRSYAMMTWWDRSCLASIFVFCKCLLFCFTYIYACWKGKSRTRNFFLLCYCLHKGSAVIYSFSGVIVRFGVKKKCVSLLYCTKTFLQVTSESNVSFVCALLVCRYVTGYVLQAKNTISI